MGNTESNVTSGVKKQAGTSTQKLYKLVDLKDPARCRDVCWDLRERGAVGETILHLCLLNATAVHADIAKRLLRFYPKLVNDIYMCDEYYGESVLHVAIVNEDPAMVKFLLDSGADVHERCFGNFMSPEDQKASRNDSQDHEWVNVCTLTNYEGYVYWGEYPLSFAACLGQEECYRLVLARGANPDAQDTNGNTVLHMLVIYEKLETFDMAYELGAAINIRNVLNLTPLTLAAKLARIEMFFHILNIEREIYWQIGSITCAAYPLSQIDTIDIETGKISKDSALNLVVFGDKDEHLELMEGFLVDLLHAKWNTFVKFRPGPQQHPTSPTNTSAPTMPTNITYSVTPTNSYTTPLEDPKEVINIKYNEKFINTPIPYLMNPNFQSILKEYSEKNSSNLAELKTNYIATTEETPIIEKDTSINSSYDGKREYTTMNSSQTVLSENELKMKRTVTETPGRKNDTKENVSDTESIFFADPWNVFQKILNGVKNTTDEPDSNDDDWWNELQEECPLIQFSTYEAKIRIVAELCMLLGAILYILAALREARFLGLNMFIENLMTAPSRVMFLFSCTLMLFMPLLRFSCTTEFEDVVAVLIMMTTSPYFLFFCRGFKTVGPFVVMIYRMVTGDLLRFVTIYLVFVMGFSQAYYIIFLTFDNPSTPEGVDDSVSNPMPNPIESIMAMFLMSMATFGDYYAAFEKTDHEWEAKLMFVLFMAIVAILLVNLLIAMMGNTYQKIAETRNEWQRQWARIVLVVERGVSPSERLKNLMLYSQPMSDGRRALVLRLSQSEEDKSEMKEILEMKRCHDRMVKKRLMGANKLLSKSPSPKRLIM
ncbi:Transient receptor potential cation channel subfamily V member 6 [Gryllus bimaculatus]|nr:Transient receptor potential cation channel subfamily V member 6 [Gryllus bimaculatus]